MFIINFPTVGWLLAKKDNYFNITSIFFIWNQVLSAKDKGEVRWFLCFVVIGANLIFIPMASISCPFKITTFTCHTGRDQSLSIYNEMIHFICYGLVCEVFDKSWPCQIFAFLGFILRSGLLTIRYP